MRQRGARRRAWDRPRDKIPAIGVPAVVPFASASADQRFATAVAHFALVLRGAKALEGQTLADSRSLAVAALGNAGPDDRRELLTMIDSATSSGGGGVLVR